MAIKWMKPTEAVVITLNGTKIPLTHAEITLWLFNIAMENGPFIDDFPIKTSIYKDFPWLC